MVDDKVKSLAIKLEKHRESLASHEIQLASIKSEVKTIADAHKAMVDLLNKILRTIIVFGVGVMAEAVFMDSDKVVIQKFLSGVWSVLSKLN